MPGPADNAGAVKKGSLRGSFRGALLLLTMARADWRRSGCCMRNRVNSLGARGLAIGLSIFVATCSSAAEGFSRTRAGLLYEQAKASAFRERLSSSTKCVNLSPFPIPDEVAAVLRVSAASQISIIEYPSYLRTKDTVNLLLRIDGEPEPRARQLSVLIRFGENGRCTGYLFAFRDS
jgi:hypothetical protein